jgi:flagellar basal body rod protein FlgB
MDAQQTKLDVIANNLANASTTGFKKTRADFQDLLSETIRAATQPNAQGGSQPTALQVGLGVRTASTSRSFAQGDMIATKNPLDLAIEVSSASSAPTATSPSPAMAVSDWMPPDALSPSWAKCWSRASPFPQMRPTSP